ncbi:hypothetical protein [Devosia sp.]
MLLFKRSGDSRRKPLPDLPPRDRQKDSLPLLGNITGLELMALFMSR